MWGLNRKNMGPYRMESLKGGGMAFKETVQDMKQLLADLLLDLDKGLLGNKAALQRVRVKSIVFEKTSKLFRKESLIAQKKEERIPLKAAIIKTKSRQISKKI